MLYTKKPKASAFSFLELSVVLVIISFLIASVTQGQKVLEKAAIQATIKQIANYKGYYQDFKITYFERPGDFSSAESFFDDGTENICNSDCSGDGDTILEENKKNDSEVLRAWQHLYLAGYEEKAYLGTWSTTSSLFVVPRAKLADSYISFVNDGGNYTNNYLKLGAYYNYSNNYSSAGVLDPNNSYKIDSKYDDGYANSGWILGRGSYDGTGYSSNCSSDAQYLAHYTADKSCTLLFAIE
jgi:type II secretory pathway pseudopilin PulG